MLPQYLLINVLMRMFDGSILKIKFYKVYYEKSGKSNNIWTN